VTPWPARGSALNPISNVLLVLVVRRRERRLQSEQKLLATPQDGWNALPVDTLTRLVDSMPRRCAQVIASKGFPIKY
jgi:hypothetical protein